MVYKEKNPIILIALLVSGLVIGGIIGDHFGAGSELKFLQRGFVLGIDPPFQLDIGMLKLNFGFLLKVNVASAIGIIISILVYRKM